MKTREEWYNYLPRTHKFKAIANSIEADGPEGPSRISRSLQDAIKEGFLWSQTPEGGSFWERASREIYTKP